MVPFTRSPAITNLQEEQAGVNKNLWLLLPDNQVKHNKLIVP